MKQLTLRVLENEYAIHRLNPYASIPVAVYKSRFYSITKTDDEISIVCETGIRIRSSKVESGWKCLQMLGPLDFNLTGILSGISHVLAEAGLALLAIATFDTDYILVQSPQLPKAISALRDAGYDIR